MDVTTYFEKFKAIKKVAEERNQTTHGHAVVEMLCMEQNTRADGLRLDEAIHFIADGKELILDV